MAEKSEAPAPPAQQPAEPPASELPRTRERWAVAALATAAFVMNLNANVMGALLPFLEAPFGLTKGDMGTLLAVAGVASALGAFLVGPLADRFGRYLPTVLGLFVFVLASVGHCAADSYGALVALRALAGAAVGVAYACASASVADLVPYGRRGAAMGHFSTGMFLAVPIGLPIAVVCGNAGYWEAVFALQGALGLVALVLAVRLVPRDTGGAAGGFRPLAPLAYPGVAAALLAVLLYVGAFFTTVQFASKWLDEAGILPRSRQMWLWVALGLASALGSFALSRVSDRTGKKNFVLLTTVGLTACLLVLMRVEDLAPLIMVGIPLAAIAAARTGPLQALMTGLVPRDKLGALMGLRAAAMQLGIGLMARLGGGLYQEHGYPTLVFVAAAAVAISYFAIRIGVPETGR